jgi:asparagine synthase (glutamine-hydrolysing)
MHRKKMGFGVPLDHWFRGSLKEMASDLLLRKSSSQRDLFDNTVIRRMLDEHVTGKARWQDQLWNLLMLEQWFCTFVDQRPTMPQADHVPAVFPN